MSIKPTTRRKTYQWSVGMYNIKTDKLLGYLEKPEKPATVSEMVFTNALFNAWHMSKQTAKSFIAVLDALNKTRPRVKYELIKVETYKL